MQSPPHDAKSRAPFDDRQDLVDAPGNHPLAVAVAVVGYRSERVFSERKALGTFREWQSLPGHLQETNRGVKYGI
jgi:hypothetical protein